MAIFNFFKTPKVRQYHHEYIYYDPEKEAREERLKRVREELAAEKRGEPQQLVRKGFLSEQRKTKTPNTASNIRWMLIVAIVALLIVWLRN